MTLSPTIPYPVSIWEEPLLSAAATTLGVLTPYLLTDGSVEFLTATDTVPVGAIEATVRDSGDGTDDIVTPAVTTGRRPTQNGNGEVFLT